MRRFPQHDRQWSPRRHRHVAAALFAALPVGLAPSLAGAAGVTAGVAAGVAGMVELPAAHRPVPGSTWAFTGEFLAMLQQNPCLSDDIAATRLARFPEGLALLRMRADLDAAQRLETAQLERESRAADGQLLRLRTMLDSMVQDVERVSVRLPRAVTVDGGQVNEQRAITARVKLLSGKVDSVVRITLQRADAMADAAPSGYLGVTLSSVPVRQALRTGYVVSYCAYPLIEAVDPGSPAERGGLRAGDTLVAFNGRDVLTNVVDYTALLVPGRTVRVSVRRSGRRTELPLRVDGRPDQTGFRVAAQWEARGSAAATGLAGAQQALELGRTNSFPSAGQSSFWPSTGNVVVFGAPGGAASVDSLRGFFYVRRDSTRTIVQGTAPRAPRRQTVMVNVSPPRTRNMPATLPRSVPALMRFGPSSEVVLAGAKLQSLGAELRASLALPEGVLVLEVLRGTPAFESGLRAGDVIQRADARAVRRVEDVRAALTSAVGAGALRLQVVDAKGASRSVQLRW